MNVWLKIILLFCGMMAFYFAVFFINYGRYKKLSKDTKNMTVKDINISLKRNIKAYIVYATVTAFAYSFVYIDPYDKFMDLVTKIIGILFILQVLLLVQTLRWGIIVKDNDIAINKTIGRTIKFKISDIEKVEIPSVDALITFKSGKLVSIYGKSKGFKLLRQRFEQEGLIH